LGTTDPSNLYHLPHLEEDPKNLDSLNNRKGEEAEHSRASMENSTSSSVDMGRKKARGNRSSTTVKYWWRLKGSRCPRGGGELGFSKNQH
jgi:hypothetical protein